MANSKFWYYPDPPGNLLVEVDLGGTVTDLKVPSTRMDQASATAFTGARTIVQWGGTSETRIRMEFAGVALLKRAIRRRLVAMLNHMDRGGSVMFAVDADKFYAAFFNRVHVAGETGISCRRSMDSVVSGVSLVDSEIVLRSANPNCLIDMQHVQGHSSGAAPNMNDILTVNPGTTYDYSAERWVLVRELGSWPALRLPESERGRDHLTSNHEISFALDLPVEEDETSLDVQFLAGGDPFAGTAEGQASPALVGGSVPADGSGPVKGEWGGAYGGGGWGF